jgi:beta-N-acetylhexosaminidase
MKSAGIKKKIGQTLMVGFQGQQLTEEFKNFLVENAIGGVILFTRNVKDPVQLAELTNSLQSLAMQNQMPLFISIDMEGGRVARLKAPFTQWPPMKILGEIDSPSLGFKFAESMGEELGSVGINMNYAPCVDILTNPQNSVIGDRAFGDNAEIVSKMSSSVVRGFVKSGIIPCVKHFPGHGDTLLDSHEDLPVVKHGLERLEEVEFVPFKRAFRARADFCMTAHLVLECVDPKFPVTLSKKVIDEILRQRLGFRNIVITDDLEMKAITKHYTVEEAAVLAVQAGCNMLMYCHEQSVQERAIEALVKAVVDGAVEEAVIEDNFQKVLQVKKKNNFENYKPVDVKEVLKIVGRSEHLSLAKSIAQKQVPPGLST